MTLKEYKPGKAFTGRVERATGESEPAWHPGAPVSQRYDPPFTFTGKIHKVTADVSGKMIQGNDGAAVEGADFQGGECAVPNPIHRASQGHERGKIL